MNLDLHDLGMTDLGARRLDTGGRLALDWNRLKTDPRQLRRATSWCLVDRPVTDLDDVLAAVGFERPADDASDARFRRLVLLAATDELAARIVIQRLLPGLLAVVRRRRRWRDRAFEELLGAAWIVVRTFNPERSPRGLAPALIADADYHAFRAAARRKSSNEVPTDIRADHRPHEPRLTPCEELAELLLDASEAGATTAEDLDLIRRLVDGTTTTELADMLQLTPRAVRHRRARVTSKLRDIALAA